MSITSVVVGVWVAGIGNHGLVIARASYSMLDVFSRGRHNTYIRALIIHRS